MDVETIHLIDQLETDRTSQIRANAAARVLLDDAIHALAAGRIEVVAEFMERARDRLKEA